MWLWSASAAMLKNPQRQADGWTASHWASLAEGLNERAGSAEVEHGPRLIHRTCIVPRTDAQQVQGNRTPWTHYLKTIVFHQYKWMLITHKHISLFLINPHGIKTARAQCHWGGPTSIDNLVKEQQQCKTAPLPFRIFWLGFSGMKWKQAVSELYICLINPQAQQTKPPPLTTSALFIFPNRHRDFVEWKGATLTCSLWIGQ